MVAQIHAITEIIRGLREGIFMFWQTGWALALGFSLSGVVQSFASRQEMRRQLGSRNLKSSIRATGYGAISSSCSYAASAMAKSLFAKGADFTNSMIFMFSSTNLVLELGIVLLVLMGWQFTAAEFIGGPLMISLLFLGGGFVFSGSLISKLRSKISSVNPDEEVAAPMPPLRQRLASKDGWIASAKYAVADVTMLRKELFIGFLAAGEISVLVPRTFWSHLFLHGHGIGATVYNAFLGPIIAILSWVCSIGNVPLAATLWSSGISFGGVISFIFADLITMPLLLIYRKMYGTKVALRMLLLFYVVMSVAGLLTQFIFTLFHAVPSRRVFNVSKDSFTWGPTAVMNILGVVLVVVVWWLSRQRHASATGTYAIDPVCSMQVRISEAPAQTQHQGSDFYFCSEHCLEKFQANPDRFTDLSAQPLPASSNAKVDPICEMKVEPGHEAAKTTYDGVTYWFCAQSCFDTFQSNPVFYTSRDWVPQGMSTPITLSPRKRRSE